MRRFASLLALLPLLVACSARRDTIAFEDEGELDTGTVTPPPDAAPDSVASDTNVDSEVDPGFNVDAAPLDAAPPLSPGFFVMVAQTPPFSIPMSEWKGVTRFDLSDVGATAVEGKGIDKSAVADPAGLAFRPESAELFVGNRHGNTAADGVPGSVSRFFYHAETKSFTPNGTILGNGLAGVHQIAFSPTSGELFCANATGGRGISRFKFDTKGNAIANGVIGTSSMRGVVVSPDGKRLYATSASNTIEQFDLKTGAALSTITVGTGTVNLHFMAVANNELYAPGIDSGLVYRFTIGSTDDLKEKDTTTGDDPIAVAFSPNGLEMFVAGHLSANVIDRYRRSSTTSTWTATKKIDTPVPGTLLVFSIEARPTIPK